MKVFSFLLSEKLEDAPGRAKKLEELGFDGTSVGETRHDPFFPMLLAAEHTKRLHVATCIAIAFAQSPMLMAYKSWDLQRYSGGRFELGLGTQVKGHIERRYSMPWTPPIPRMREYVQSLRAIWNSWQNGVKLDYKGKDYSFSLMTPMFNPGPIQHPHIPVYLAAVTPAMAKLTGEVGDGIFLHPLSTPKYIREVLLPAIREGAKKANRSLDTFDVSSQNFIITGRTEADLQPEIDRIRRQIAFYASTRTYKVVMDTHGWGDVTDKLFQLSLKGQVGGGSEDVWKEMAGSITDEIFNEFVIVATYDTVAKRIKERFGGLVTRIAMSIPAKSPADEEAAKDVLRQLHAA